MLALLVTILLACPPLEGELDAVAKKVGALICEDPKDFKDMFSDEFLQQVPAEAIHDLFAQGFRDHGAVSEIRPLDRENDLSGRFEFFFPDHTAVVVTLTLEDDEDCKIRGLFISPPRLVIDTFADVTDAMKKLPGEVSFKVVKLGEEPRTLAEIEPDKALAIGSAFKLYVLGALVEDKRKWDEVVTIREEWKSLPSGVMQNWPTGGPATLHTLAVQMISISDNTAADHLLHVAGRERVEAIMEAMGNADAKRSRPFLTTLELFKLRTKKDLRKAYTKADEAGRRALLAKDVKDVPREQVGMWGKPGAISKLEWFASGADLCRAMDWFRKKNDATAMGVLAVNRGLNVRKDVWPYCGFKGGSEPGVINLTYLLKRDDGTWYALSGSWNDKDRPVDENRWFTLIGAAIDILAKSGR